MSEEGNTPEPPVDSDDEDGAEEELPVFPGYVDVPTPVSLDQCLWMLTEEIPRILAQRGINAASLPFPPEIVTKLTEKDVENYAHAALCRFGEDINAGSIMLSYLSLPRNYWDINMSFLRRHGENSHRAEDIRAELRKLKATGDILPIHFLLSNGR
jgi:hypothetical protein